MLRCEVFGQAVQQAAAIVGFFVTALFEFDYVLADVPLGLHQ
jgi:hypothetical protein